MINADDPKMIRFAQILEAHQIADLKRQGLDCEANIRNCKVSIGAGKKYHKVDVGGSGKYMVDVTSGAIYGIKAYGVVHKGHQFGTLDTIDGYSWGGYRAGKLANPSQTPTPTVQTPPADPGAFLNQKKVPTVKPEVGMGATMLYYTDRDAYTVIEVIDDETIVVQHDNAKRTDNNGQSNDQTYEYSPNPDGEKIKLTWRKSGQWMDEGLATKSAGHHWAIGERRKYIDFGF